MSGIACCGRALPEEGSDGEEDGGGDGKRDAPPVVAVATRFCSASFALVSGSGAVAS